MIMVILNIALMTLIVAGILTLLGWGILTDKPMVAALRRHHARRRAEGWERLRRVERRSA
jgi:hypothetical protein